MWVCLGSCGTFWGVLLKVTFSEGDVGRLDGARGQVPRAAWIRGVVLAALGVVEGAGGGVGFGRVGPAGVSGVASVGGLPGAGAAAAVDVSVLMPPGRRAREREREVERGEREAVAVELAAGRPVVGVPGVVRGSEISAPAPAARKGKAPRAGRAARTKGHAAGGGGVGGRPPVQKRSKKR